MTFDPNEYLDFGVMDQPPRFASSIGIEGKETLIVTDGADFPALVVEWPEMMGEERAEDFWALGLLHLSKIEIARLPSAPRVAAIALLSGAERRDPRTLALGAAAIVGLR